MKYKVQVCLRQSEGWVDADSMRYDTMQDAQSKVAWLKSVCGACDAMLRIVDC